MPARYAEVGIDYNRSYDIPDRPIGTSLAVATTFGGLIWLFFGQCDHMRPYRLDAQFSNSKLG